MKSKYPIIKINELPENHIILSYEKDNNQTESQWNLGNDYCRAIFNNQTSIAKINSRNIYGITFTGEAYIATCDITKKPFLIINATKFMSEPKSLMEVFYYNPVYKHQQQYLANIITLTYIEKNKKSKWNYQNVTATFNQKTNMATIELNNCKDVTFTGKAKIITTPTHTNPNGEQLLEIDLTKFTFQPVCLA